jgi:hypothetical protein
MKINQSQCHDCGCQEGEIHELGCDMERCPFCGGQLISCDCRYKLLGIDDSPSTYTYEHGLTLKQEESWLKVLDGKGRVPFIQWPTVCARCGKLWPEMFMVSDEEWNHYIEIRHRHDILCRECFDEIKALIDNADK